jgi:hypothetical protein
MKPQRDLCDPARPGCAEDWNGPNGPKNGPKWPEEWPEWPATEKMPMILGRCRVRPVRKAHAYPPPRPTSAWGEGGGEGRWLEVAIAPSPVALPPSGTSGPTPPPPPPLAALAPSRAPASPRGGERRGCRGRKGRHARRALFMSGYTRKAAGYAGALSSYLESLDFSDGARTQSARISSRFELPKAAAQLRHDVESDPQETPCLSNPSDS